MKTLSILIPTINQTNDIWEKYIDILLKQISNIDNEIRGYFNYNIVVVENMLVNEAWNKMVSKCTSEIVLILNDDIVLWEEVFYTLSKIERWKVYCPYFSRKNDFNKIYSDNWNNIIGFCFWMYRDDWRKIPKEIKLWYWDNYIYEYMNHNILYWWYIHHWESKSLSDEKQKAKCAEIISQDKINWVKIYETIHSDTESTK